MELKSALSYATVIITNVLPSGAAFACRVDDGANCYIPVTVAQVVNAHIGDRYHATIVFNRYPDKAERTPWLAVYLSTQLGVVAPPAATPVVPDVPAVFALSTFDRVASRMESDGVWTVGTMFDEMFPGMSRADSTTEYNAVSSALRKMYDSDRCAKFSMWRSVHQAKASKEWFTCHPENVDVDEWEV